MKRWIQRAMLGHRRATIRVVARDRGIFLPVARSNSRQVTSMRSTASRDLRILKPNNASEENSA